MDAGRREKDDLKSAKKLDKSNQIFDHLDDMIARILKIKEGGGTTPTLTFDELRELCLRCRALFLQEAAFLEIKAPLTIFGDLHGQLMDLQKMMRAFGLPPKTRYLFMGDYVDRGSFSVETVSLLMAFKLRHPRDVFLLRGNHETRIVNFQYGFLDECKRKYEKGVELWTHYQHVFNCLPVAAVVGRRIFCAHGGISPHLKSFKQFKKIQRPTDITDCGLLTDILWSDPSPKVEYFDDSPRQVGKIFGKQAIADFCKRFDIDLICRAHQCVEDGYAFFAGRSCLTIFSAPYYCGQAKNLAGVLLVSKDLKCQVQMYDPHLKKTTEKMSAKKTSPTSPSTGKCPSPLVEAKK